MLMDFGISEDEVLINDDFSYSLRNKVNSEAPKVFKAFASFLICFKTFHENTFVKKG
jgi:hypothetical protein